MGPALRPGAVMKLNTNMRIIAGSVKGRSLVCLAGEEVRPTPERMRQAMFNVIGPELPGANILDLFSGTGSLGLEALSRGAEHCVFVENGFGALKALRQNIETLGFEPQAIVLSKDVFQIEKHLEELGRSFDIIFAAPPYPLIENPGTAAELFEVFGRVTERFGTENVTLNLQNSPVSQVPEKTNTLERFDHRGYGNAELSRFGLGATGSLNSIKTGLQNEET